MNIYAVTSLIGSTSSLFLGIFVFLKNKDRPINRSFGLLGLGIFIWVFGCFMESSVSTHSSAVLWDRFLYTGATFTPTLFLHFSLVVAEKRRKRILTILYLLSIIFLFLNLTPNLRPLFIKDVQHKFTFRYIAVPGPIWYLYLLYFAFCGLYPFYILTKTLKEEISAHRKEQIKYMILSLVVIFIAASMYLSLVLSVAAPPIDNLLVATFSFITAYAIIRHQLMEIEVIIKKTVVFAEMFAFVFGVVVAVAMLVAQLLGGANNLLALAISALVITFTLRPLETFLINSTDKFLFQKKYEYKQILKAFIDEVITVLNLDEVVNSTLKLLDQTLHLYTASIFILNKVEDKYQLYSSIGLEDKNIVFTSESKLITFLKKSHNVAVIRQINGIAGVSSDIQQELIKLKSIICLPLLLHDDLIGFISLGKKKSDEEYTKDDLDILLDLARTESIAVGNAQLLTEAAQAERRAAIGTMAAGINHEIGNPLNIINTKIQVFLVGIQRGLYNDKPKEEVMQECTSILNETIKQTNRIAEITRKLSNFAKPSKEFKPQLINILEEIEETLSMVGHELELEKIKIEKELPFTLPKMLADKREMQQILFNLIRNAGQAIEGEGKIIIRVLSTNDGRVHMEIQDTGKGIPEDKISRIFEPFFTTKGPNKGTGLGLSIVRQLVWKNKGEISFRSHVGVGTTFILEFPGVES